MTTELIAKGPMTQALTMFLNGKTRVAESLQEIAQKLDDAFQKRADAAAIMKLLERWKGMSDPNVFDRMTDRLRPGERFVWNGLSDWPRMLVRDMHEKLTVTLMFHLNKGDVEAAAKLWEKRHNKFADPDDALDSLVRDMRSIRFLEPQFKFGPYTIVDRYGINEMKVAELFEALKAASTLLKRKGFSYLLGGLLELEYDKQHRFDASYNIPHDSFSINFGKLQTVKAMTRELIHEHAHRLWFKHMDAGARDTFAKEWLEHGRGPDAPTTRVPSVTRYGTTDRHEDFAETFTEVVMGRQKNRRLAERLQAVLPKGRVLSNTVRSVGATLLGKKDETMKRQVIACLLRAGRTELANTIAYRVTTAVVNFREEDGMGVLWAPSYMAIKDALPAIKKAGFRYQPADKSWRIDVKKLTPQKRKKLSPYVVFDKKDTEKEIRELLKQLDGLQHFRVRFGSDGFGISGDVWTFKDTVKSAGGTWEKHRNQYTFYFDATDVGKLNDAIGKIKQRERYLGSEQQKLSKVLPELVKKSWTILQCSVYGTHLNIQTSDRKYRDVVKKHFPAARWKQPYWAVRLTEIDVDSVERFIAAVDDLQADANKESKTSDTPAPRKTKVSNAPYVFSRGEGYGADYLQPGTILRSNPKHHDQKGWPEHITVVKTTKYFVREDGLSVGVGDESGYIYTYHCREATPEEAAERMTADQKRKAKKEAEKRLAQISRDFMKHGVHPEPWVVPEGTRYDVTPQNLYGGGEWYVISGPRIWHVQNNGADGDDWSHNNVRTGGAGAIGYYIDDAKLVEEVRQLFGILGIVAK